MSNWERFVAARLWELLPAELCVRLQWSNTPHLVSALAVMQQPDGAYGCTFYFDVRAFDAMWSGEPFPLEAVTAIGSEDDAGPQWLRLHHAQPVQADAMDRELLNAALGLLFRQLEHDAALTVLSDGSMLSLATR